ncbi:WRKY domain-containing protein [Forsythia ovata]|uniref:WRKY domain-containing protein n=1 Tax=Forsythia ovata TaxID=205694 RepID=A0ABD1S939_9LAMI
MVNQKERQKVAKRDKSKQKQKELSKLARKEEKSQLNYPVVGCENEVNEDGWEYVEEGSPEIIWQGNEIIVKKKKFRVKKNDIDQLIVKEPADNGFVELAGELGWFADVGFTVMDCPTLVGPSWAHSDVEVFMPIGEEDESLFGDLGDLPESSVVLRQCQVETPCCGGTG